MFSIDEGLNICYSEHPVQDAVNFSTRKALMNVADVKKWSREKLEEIWNSFAGVVPFQELRRVKKFRNRPFAIQRIWEVIQRLAPASFDQNEKAVGEVVESARVKKAKKAKPAKAEKGNLSKAKKSVNPKKQAEAEEPRAAKTDVPVVRTGRKAGQHDKLITLISTTEGASIEELMKEMGWTATHSARGRISMLKSGGMKIE